MRICGRHEIVNHILGRQFDDDRPIDRHVQFAEHDNVILRRRIVRVEPERDSKFVTRLMSRRPNTPSGPGQMEVPVELLTDGVDENRIAVFRETRFTRFAHSGTAKPTSSTASIRTTANSRCVEMPLFTPSWSATGWRL